MDRKGVARLVLTWARESGVADLDVFCENLRSRGLEMPRLFGDAEALELAKDFPWSPGEIWSAFGRRRESASVSR